MTTGGSVVQPGIDVIEIERIRKAVERKGEKFLKRLFTEAERAYCAKFQDAAPCLAARFAAKEAVAKSLGCGIGKTLSWHDIEITRNREGVPQVALSAGAKALFNNPRISLSISHSQNLATAIAINLSF